MRLEFVTPRERPADESHDFLDRLRSAQPIACRSPEPDEETGMAGDAVADLAETGQVDEQSLLEERRKRGVGGNEFAESPEVRHDLWCVGDEPEEVRQHAEACFDLGVQRCRLTWSVRVALWG